MMLDHCNILKDMIFVLFELINELFPDVQPDKQNASSYTTLL
jgi:hypothetical protein